MQAESHVKVSDLSTSGGALRNPWIPEQWDESGLLPDVPLKKIKGCLLKVSFMCTLLLKHHFPLAV